MFCHFNPRPREEGDCLTPFALNLRFISIHALVKRATQSQLYTYILSWISIHALVKRATCLSKKFHRCTVPFQSTPS